MSDEVCFLSAIRERPEDDVTRLVYADWLDERGDVRGRVIRLANQIKQARAEIRRLLPDCDVAWLADVRGLVTVSVRTCPLESLIPAIKEFREITGCGLKEAVEIVRGGWLSHPDQADKDAIIRRVYEEDDSGFYLWLLPFPVAMHVRDRLRKLGAVVDVLPIDVPAPSPEEPARVPAMSKRLSHKGGDA